MPVDTGEFLLEKQFVLLIYPFRHTTEGKERDRLLQRLEGNWRPWWHRFASPEEKARTWDDTYFFLPHLRQLLFPETAAGVSANPGRHEPSEQEGAKPTQFASLSPEQFAKQVGSSGVLRLTRKQEQVDALNPIGLRMDREGSPVPMFSIPVGVQWVDLILFPQSVGFLVLKVELKAEKLTVKHLSEFLYYVRMIHPPTIDWILARWELFGEVTPGGEVPPSSVTSRDLVDYLLADLFPPEDSTRQKKNNAEATSHSLLAARVEKAVAKSGLRVSDTDIGQVYGQSFHLYTYGCLDASTAAHLLTIPAGASLPFNSPAEQSLYEIATATDLTDPNYVPHPAQVKQLMDQGLIALWANWQGLALHDNVAYLGLGSSKFLLEGLPRNVETDYFHLYLLAFYQKIRLSFLSGELVRRDTVLHLNLNKATTLWDDFMRFRNHYWFEEVTFKPQGIELYTRFQQALLARPLYETVSKEVRDLQEYYSGKATQRATSLIFFLTVIGLPVTLTMGLFSSARFHYFAWFAHDTGRHLALTFVLLAAGFVFAANLWVRYFANLGQKVRREKRQG